MTQTLNPLLRSLEPPARATGIERRSVAVLFADISGFTALVESVDPEMVYQVVRPLMDELVLRVHLHGGQIQQVLGDGFMAVFGLQSQRGDESERAVRAGLALLSAGDGTVCPPIHVGIESGEVLVTPSWEPAGFAVWGRPVTLAKRLCDLAGPGTLQVGPTAFQRAGAGVESAVPVAAHLKGIAAAIMAHGVTALS